MKILFPALLFLSFSALADEPISDAQFQGAIKSLESGQLSCSQREINLEAENGALAAKVEELKAEIEKLKKPPEPATSKK